MVENGQEAVMAMKENDFDVILMDIHMPEMDGLAATRLIRKELPAERQPYIIALTADVMEGFQQRCLDVGMDAYISKPVRIDELAATSAEGGGNRHRVNAAAHFRRSYWLSAARFVARMRCSTGRPIGFSRTSSIPAAKHLAVSSAPTPPVNAKEARRLGGQVSDTPCHLRCSHIRQVIVQEDNVIR